MNRVFSLTVSFLLLIGSAGLCVANVCYASVADDNTQPEVLDGRTVEISAKVIAINADSKSMELFDSENNTMIQVRLTQLRKSERKALIRSDVRRVAVTGRAWTVGGRLLIDAQKIQALPLNAKDDASLDAGK